MDKRKLMLLLGAMLVALGSALAVRSTLAGHGTPAVKAAILAPSTGPRVLVAQRALPIGTIITPDAVAFQTWPRDMVRDAYFLDGSIDKARLIGTVVRHPITAGEPLTQGALVAPGDRGFLAAALAPGMRAITIPVSDMSGVAGFIFPGDHVDMMLTQTVKSSNPADASGLSLNLTETMLRNLRVLATDQTTETEVGANGKSVVKIAHDVTLEVSPRVAEKIEVAQTLGTLSLALRPLADDQGASAPAMLRGVNSPIGPGGKRLAGMSTGRFEDGAPSFSTGGDVSRFALRRLPMGAPAPRLLPLPIGGGVKIVRGNSVAAEPAGTGLFSRMQSAAAMSGPPAGMQPMQPALAGGE